MRRWRLFGNAACCLFAVSLTAATVIQPTSGVVRGHILACDALDYHGTSYSGGPVTVLKGVVRWRQTSGEPTLVDVLPPAVVAKQLVSADAGFTFDLAAGRYVLVAAPAGDYGAYATVTVGAGDDLVVDIPNGCI